MASFMAFAYLLIHLFIHLTCIFRKLHSMQGLHWALVPVLEEPQLMEGQMRESLGRQRRPLSSPGLSRKAPWRR